MIKYDLRYNLLSNEIAEHILENLYDNKIVRQLELPTNVQYKLR